MIAKNNLIAFRVDDEELNAIKKAMEKEHFAYLSNLIRKATFTYIDYMNKQEATRK